MITQKTLYRKIKPYSDYGLYVLLLLLSLILLSTVTSCQNNNLSSPNTSGTPPAIKDLRKQDGCGFVLEPEIGEPLESLYAYVLCGTPPCLCLPYET
jgi:hypothetical protein